MTYDPIKMRGEVRAAHQQNGALSCAWCNGDIYHGFDPHHALVKRSQVNHAAIDDVANIVPLHRICHSEHGQSSEMTVKALDYLIARLGAERIARWCIDLWRVHGLSVTRGTFPESSKRFRCPACNEVMTHRDLFASDGSCMNYGDTCIWEDVLDEFIDFGAVTEQEWREYLELVVLPL